MSFALVDAVVRDFSTKVEIAGEHWLWLGEVDKDGHGLCRVDGQKRRVHRVVYELLIGPIPEGDVLDHVCRVRQCVNPIHVEPVAHAVNVKRGGPSTRTHCPRGHPYDAENTHIYITKQGWRERTCRTCKRASDKARREAKKRGNVEGRALTVEDPSPTRSALLDQPPPTTQEGIEAN